MSNLTITLDPADVRLAQKANDAWLALIATQDGTPEEIERQKHWEEVKTCLAFVFIAMVQRAEESRQ